MLTTVPHPNPDSAWLINWFHRTSEELIETLEENQVQLQNMMTSKYIAYFLEEISAWQKCLSVVDQVGKNNGGYYYYAYNYWFEVAMQKL